MHTFAPGFECSRRACGVTIRFSIFSHILSVTLTLTLTIVLQCTQKYVTYSSFATKLFHDIPNQRHRTYILHWQIICNDAAQKKNKDRQNEEESGSQVVIVVAAFKSFRLSVKFRHVHFQWDFLNLIYNISIFENENSGTIEYF